MVSRSIAALLCVAVALSFAVAAEEAKNLIDNGNLEAAVGNTGIPQGWSTHNKPDGTSYKASVVDDAKSGKKSLLIEGDGQYGVVSTGGRPIDAKLRYTARGFVKLEGEGAKATVKIDYFDDKWNWLASTTAGEVTSDMKGWQAVSVVDRAAIDAPKAANFNVSLSLTGKGKAWFDDIELTAAPGKGETNLIYNGDIENFAGTRPANWWVGSAEGGKVEATISTDKPKEGKHCLRFKGSAEWAVATCGKVKFDKSKTYTVTGFIRTRAGAGQIKIDYFEGDQWLGSTFGEDVLDAEWTEKTVSTTDEFPGATHIAATCVGTGDFDVDFDAIVVTVK